MEPETGIITGVDLIPANAGDGPGGVALLVGEEPRPEALGDSAYGSGTRRCGAGRRRGFYDRLVSLEWEQTIVDSRDPSALGRWWREALSWVVVNDDPDEFEIRPSADRLPGLLFVPVPESKMTKNRLHLDFRPDDRDVEVERLLALGATRADVGQGEQSWIVLADPEGNEFCVLGSRSL
jgi:Glyoxalase-like domain